MVSAEHLRSLPPAQALPTLAGLMVVESLGAPIPSEIVLPAAGWWAQSAHFASPAIVLAAAFIACTLGSLIGCCIAYAVGYYGGPGFVRKFGRYLLVSQKHLDHAERWLEGKGAWAFTASRLVVGVRALISYPVGAAHMPFRLFLLYTTLGISVFDAALIYLGYRYGGGITHTLHRFGRELLAGVIAICVGLFAWRWWKIKQSGGLDAADSDEVPVA